MADGVVHMTADDYAQAVIANQQQGLARPSQDTAWANFHLAYRLQDDTPKAKALIAQWTAESQAATERYLLEHHGPKPAEPPRKAP